MEQHDAYLARIAQAVSISEPLQHWLASRNEGGRGVSDPAILKVLEALRTPVPAHRWLQDPTLAAALPLLLRSADMKSVSAVTKNVSLVMNLLAQMQGASSQALSLLSLGVF